jgi:hypothetical protein
MILASSALIVMVVAFILLKPGDDAPVPTSTPEATSATGSTQEASKPKQPRPTKLVVRAGAPVGGVKKISIDKGKKLRFTVFSDVADEVHFHGYDVSKPVGPGEPARFVVPARLDGIYEVELEQRAIPIAEIRVNP